MAPSRTESVDDATLKNSEKEIATALVHLKRLYRAKNRLCSPLLRLPTEIIIHILSCLMEDMGLYLYPVWRSIFTTCYRIRRIMCNATTLWWKVVISLRREANVALMRSGGSPRVVIAKFVPWDEWENVGRRDVLIHWKDQWALQGQRLHTLEFHGTPWHLLGLSWIFEQSLPCLEYLKLHLVSGVNDDVVLDPVAVRLPTNMLLRVLDLRNVILPWSSAHFTGLSELHLDFTDVVVSMVEDELLRILNASPQLVRLSLVQVDHTIPTNGDQQHPLKRTVRLPALIFLKLDNDPNVVGYTLACLDTPILASLEVHSRVSDWGFARSLTHFFPDDRLPRKLFSDPPTFVVQRHFNQSVEFGIGSFKVQFGHRPDDTEASYKATAVCVPLVPPSVTALELDFSALDVQEWKQFFRLHPAVRSVECRGFHDDPMSESFWVALSSAGDDDQILCPELESLVLGAHAAAERLIPLFRCLHYRGSVGFELKHLKIAESSPAVYRMAEHIHSLVGALEIDFPSELEQKVGQISMDTLAMC